MDIYTDTIRYFPFRGILHCQIWSKEFRKVIIAPFPLHYSATEGNQLGDQREPKLKICGSE